MGKCLFYNLQVKLQPERPRLLIMVTTSVIHYVQLMDQLVLNVKYALRCLSIPHTQHIPSL